MNPTHHHQLTGPKHALANHAALLRPVDACCQRQEACLQLQSGAADPRLPAWQCQQYACALHSIRGLAFYSTPHQPLPRLALPEYEYVLPDMSAVCHKFKALADQQQWQTLGVGAAVQVSCLVSSSFASTHATCHRFDKLNTFHSWLCMQPFNRKTRS